jgi:Recombinase
LTGRRARYEIAKDEANNVREVCRRYTEEQISIGELARWLTAEQIRTYRQGPLNRSLLWAMLKYPAHTGRVGSVCRPEPLSNNHVSAELPRSIHPGEENQRSVNSK